jgi:hypothetical protein
MSKLHMQTMLEKALIAVHGELRAEKKRRVAIRKEIQAMENRKLNQDKVDRARDEYEKVVAQDAALEARVRRHTGAPAAKPPPPPAEVAAKAAAPAPKRRQQLDNEVEDEPADAMFESGALCMPLQSMQRKTLLPNASHHQELTSLSQSTRMVLL